jgi:hypothetical protein
VKRKFEISNSADQLYSIVEVALKWRTTVSRASKVLKREPGVLPVRTRKPLREIPDRLHQKRIPASVLERVENRIEDRASEGSEGYLLKKRCELPKYGARVDVPELQDMCERLFSFNEISAMLQIGRNNTLQLFRDEPGIFEVNPPRFGRRKGHWALYSTPRVPASVLQRVHERLTRRREDLDKNDSSD